MLSAFKHYLLSLSLSSTSRKLYLSDVSRFLSSLSSSPTLDTLLDSSTYTRYLSSLESQATAPSMLRRTRASLRQFGSYLSLTYSVASPMQSVSATPANQNSTKVDLYDKYIKLFTNYLIAAHLSPLTIKSYKSDVARYLDWCVTTSSSRDINGLLTNKNIGIYLNHLTQSLSCLPSTIERKSKSLVRFQDWIHNVYQLSTKSDNKSMAEDHSRSLGEHSHPPLLTSPLSVTPDTAPVSVKKRNSRKWITTLLPYFTSPGLRNFATLSVLLIFAATLGIFGYRQFSRDVTLTAAFPSTPITPNRQLSFQGRLENAAGTPITTSTNLTFKLFDDETVGTQLYTSGTCAITPDSDGVFSTQIGDTCGSAIASSVFSENANVWLEVTVAAETLTPRQQIASVAYALNSETLQGFPISSTVSAIRNTVVPMNQWGEILVGEQNPRMRGISGTFAISAPALSFTTNVGTNGNISFAPDGTGQINATGNTTTTNFFNISNAQLTTGSLITGTAANNNSGFKLIDLLSGSSPTSKFSVTDAGLTTVGADLYVSSGISLYSTAVSTGTVEATQFCTGDGETNCVTDFSTLGVNYWSRVAGNLSPATLNDTISATTSAAVALTLTQTGAFNALLVEDQASDTTPFVINESGNVGIGTSTADSKLSIGSAGSTNYTAYISNGDDYGLFASGNNYGLWGTGSNAGVYGVVSGTAHGVLGSATGTGSGVYGTSNNVAGYGIQGRNTSSGIGGYFTSSSGHALITGTGNVGIGTTTPTALLDVAGAASVSGTLTLGNGTTNTLRTPYGPLNFDYKSGLNTWGTAMTIDDITGYIGINNTTPSQIVHALQQSDVIGLDIMGEMYSSVAGNRTNFKGDRSRGTVGAAAIVQDGDALVGLTGRGYDGSAYQIGARLAITVDGTPGSGDMPGRFQFFTTPDGSSTPLERMRIDSAGFVGIGDTSPDAALDVVGDVYISSGLSTFGTAVSDGTIEATQFCTGDGETNCVTDFSTLGVNYWSRVAGNLSPATLNDTISATTSAAVALTLTQTGAFNALLVEDQASDTTPFVIDQSGNVGIGTTAPVAKLGIVDAVTLGGTASVYGTSLVQTLTGTPTTTVTSHGNYSSVATNVSDGTQSLTTYAGYAINQLGTGNTIDTLYGQRGSAVINSDIISTAGNTATTSAGLVGLAYLSAAGTVTNQYGTSSFSYLNADGGTITNSYGIQGQSFENLNPTSGGITSSFGGSFIGQDGTTSYGVYAQGLQNTSNTETFASLYGTYSDCSTASSTVTVTNCYGVRGNVTETSGTITNGYAGYFTTSSALGSAYGVYANVLGASTTNYGIFSNVSGGTTNYAGVFMGGNVGIGDATPDAPLDVVGDVYISDGLSLYETAVSDGTVEAAQFCTGDGETNCVTDFSTLGVNYWSRVAGNLSPATLNDTISATTSAAVALTLTQTGAFNALLVEDQASDTTPFVIDQSGNVGIFTPSPIAPLQVYTDTGTGNGAIYLGTGANASTMISAQGRAYFGYGAGNMAIVQGALTKGIQFNVNNNTFGAGEAARITSTGLFGIGNTNPTATLDVGGTASVSGALTLGNGTTNTLRSPYGPLSFDYKSGLNTWGTAMIVDDITGNVGIGDTTPASLLTVGSGDLFQVDTAGDIVKIKNLTYAWPSAHTTNGILQNDGAGVLTWATLGAAAVTPDSLDYTEFQDTMDFDANLITNQGAFTNTYNYTGTTSDGLTYNADSVTSAYGAVISADGLTSGAALRLNSSSTAGTTSSSSSLLSLSRTGANANATHTAYGILASVLNTGTTSTNIAAYLDANGATSNYSLITNRGNVGIGTATPAELLTVSKTRANANTMLRLEETGTDTDTDIGIEFWHRDLGAGALDKGGRIATERQSTSATYDMVFYGWSGSASTEYFRIESGGELGIGTSQPEAALDINSATGDNLQLTYNDADGGSTTNSQLTMDSSGNLTINNTGTKTIVADDLQVSGGDILDSNGNESIRFGTTASAVNEVTVTNAATAGTVAVAATGGDTDIALSIDSKGADALNLNGTATGDVNLAGGSGSTGCTVSNSTGNLTCTGIISGAAASSKWNAITAPDGNLSLAHAGFTTAFTFNSVTTATAFDLSTTSLTTGKILNLASTSTALTTGNLLSLDWSPSTPSTGSGDLFSLNIGANGNYGNLFNIKDAGSSLFSVSETVVTSNLPTSFTAAGDVSMAYDLYFTNPTSSAIGSSAPFSIVAGETFNSSNLTLQTYNSGDIVMTTDTLTLQNITGAANTTLATDASGNLTINNSGTKTTFADAAYFANGSTYYVDSTGNAKFLDLQIADTGNPGITLGDGTTGYFKVGGSTISDASGNLLLDSDSGTVSTPDHFSPTVDDTQDLGTSSLRWANLYLGPATLHVGTSATDESTISYNTTSNIMDIGTDSTSNGDIAFFTDDLYLDKSTANVGIGTTGPLSKLSVGGVGNSNYGIYGIGVYGIYGEENVAAVGGGVYGKSIGTNSAGVIGTNSSTGYGVYGVNSSTGAGGYFFNSSTGYALITGTGNVGIGDASPTNKLDVTGAIGISDTTVIDASRNLTNIGTITSTGIISTAGEIRNTTSANASPYTQARLTVYRDGGNWGYLGYGSDALMRVVYSSTASSAPLLFGTSSAVDNTGTFTERMRLDGSGNLNPAGYIAITAAQDTSGNLRFSAANPYISASSYFVAPGGAYFNSGTVYAEAEIRARGGIADDGGNLVLNDAVDIPSTLTLTGTAANIALGSNYLSGDGADEGLLINSTGLGSIGAAIDTNVNFRSYSATVPYSILAENTTANGIGVYGSTNGTNGIGTYGANNNTGYGMMAYNSGTGYAFYCNATAANKCGGNQAWFNASDRKLKGNIAPITNALSKVLNLEGVTYYLKNDPAQTPQMGFIAQDVLPYAPEVVAYDENNDYYGMQTGQLTALLANAIKELNFKVDQNALNDSNVAALTLSEYGDLIIIGDDTIGYSVQTSEGTIIDKITSFASATIASIQAGLTTTNTLQVANISPLDGVPNITVTAPVVIAPPSDTTQPALVIDGEIDASTISARTALLSDIQANTITATNIVADTIEANHIIGLDAKIATLSAGITDQQMTTITDRIKSRLEALTGNLPTASDIPLPSESQGSTDLIASSSIATSSATLSSADIDFATINNYLAVIGTATITTLDITSELYTNTISSKSNLLALQPNGGIINLAGNTLIVDSTGEVMINGILTVSGKILADSASLNTLELGTPLDATASALGQLLSIYDESGTAVATIDASGSANLASLTTGMITIASSGDATSSSLLSSNITSNATAGESVLISPDIELTISSPYVTKDTLVYLTPTTNTENKVLFVKSKNTCDSSTTYDPQSSVPCSPSFTVGIDAPASTDISFNWWIISLKSSIAESGL